MKKILVITVGLSCAISSLADSRTVSYLKDRKDPKGTDDGFVYAKKKVDLGERASTEGLIKRCIYNHISIHNNGYDDAAIQRNLKREPKFVYSREEMPQVSAGKDVAFSGGTLFVYVNKERMKFTPGLYCNGTRSDKRHMPLMADIYEVINDPSLKTAKVGLSAGQMEIVPRDVSPKFRASVGLRDSKDAAEAAVAASAQSTDSTQTTSGAVSALTPEQEDEKLYELSGSPEYVAGLDSEKDAKISGAIDRVAARRNESKNLAEELSSAQKANRRYVSEARIWEKQLEYSGIIKGARARGESPRISYKYISSEGSSIELKELETDEDVAHARSMMEKNIAGAQAEAAKVKDLEAHLK